MTDHPIIFQTDMVQSILSNLKWQTRRIIKPQPRLLGDDISWDYTDGHSGKGWYAYSTGYRDDGSLFYKCPYGTAGDKLWVKETWALWGYGDNNGETYIDVGYKDDEQIAYAIDGINFRHYSDKINEQGYHPCRPKWRPSIYMPKWAARIWLDVLKVRVERVADISVDDAIAEGVECLEAACAEDNTPTIWRDYLINPEDNDGCGYFKTATASYSSLWNSINAKPKPVSKNKKILYYESYPFNGEKRIEEHRGLPHYIHPNPYVWVVDFKRNELGEPDHD